MSFKKVDAKVSFPKLEEAIIECWEQEKIFEKSIANRAGKPAYVFYDGPPFATGTPHYGHIVASTIKDTVPRYWTMRGYQVERKWGWDCHGLPIENIAEKELGITHKKEIEALGVAKFNEVCRSKVLEYVGEWKKVMRRFGRWADMENAYRTMDRDFMESVWWVFKELWDKGLIYESYRTMHICPRCETTLSQSEVAEGYKDVKDLAVTAKFELVDEPGTYVLAWTTTPWTLPGNVALAVNEKLVYVQIKINKIIKNETGLQIKENESYIVADARVKDIFGLNMVAAKQESQEDLWKIDNTRVKNEKLELEIGYKIFSGKDLKGRAYKPLFPFLKDIIKSGKTPKSLKKQGSNESVAPQFAIKQDERFEERSKEISKDSQEFWKFDDDGTAYKIYHADFVTTDMGTGIAHEAPAFGEEDMELGNKEKFPFVQHVKLDGTIEEEVTGFGGMQVKPKSDEDRVRFGTDIAILKYLQDHGTFFAKENITHSYPHCWRCDTPLLNYATSSWFVRVAERKEKMIALADDINWSPTHIKAGRWGKWLEGARDWSISRQRYWASVMPLWVCNQQPTTDNQQRGCGAMRVFGSVAELEEVSGKKIDDLHKHIVDEVTVPCTKCGGVMHRVPDVLDTWFDSGSMPYGERHYPFENKEKFDAAFPAQFIAEGVDQTRCWFYYLHVIATGIKETKAFQNVVVNGIVLAEDGRKMSKKLKNYPDPMEILNKYGSDVLRYYLMSSPVVAAENLNFSERDMSDIQRGVFRMLWNSYSFFTTYAAIDNWEPKTDAKASDNLLDRWILSELQLMTREVNAAMEAYELNRATRAFTPFIDNLSNRYIRRSRNRFWKSEDDGDKEQAYQTLYTVLVTLAKLMAPFTPFLSEEIYKNLAGDESVHLADYPVADESLIDKSLVIKMQLVWDIINQALKERSMAGIKVRQPLAKLEIFYKDQSHPLVQIEEGLQSIVKDEVNLKEIVFTHSDLSSLDDSQLRGWMTRLDTDIEKYPELKLEGEAREIIRAIQEGRKRAGFNVEDRIVLGYIGKDAVFANTELAELIQHEVLATTVQSGTFADADYTETIDIEGESLTFSLKRA